ncbi:MAG: hypothetical protein QOC94_276 [Actinoplanes sp.]|jgi:hypothetical protein|nr:hypothetical protein [Actinoplanes sp.]
MTRLERLAYWLVRRAARRWPEDLAEPMTADWLAELDVLRTRSGVGQMLKFAGSLALSAAVEDEGEEPASRFSQAGSALASAAGVTLLAAALFNGVHLVDGAFGGVTGPALLAAASAVMVVAGARVRAHALRWVVLLGGGLFAFLLAGNQVAVMPFMGWRDIAPAVATWALLSMATTWAASRLVSTGRTCVGALTCAAGGLIAMDLGTIAGSLHAADEVGAGLGWAPAWFALALLPGGTVTFGTYFPNGSTALGNLPAAGQPFHASDILLGNASAMTGPMLLCTVFLTAVVLSPGRHPGLRDVVALVLPVPARQLGAEPQTDPARRSLRTPFVQISAAFFRMRRVDLRTPLGVGAALGALAGCAVLRQLTVVSADGTLHRLLDNSNVFGFGFVADTPGQIVVALLAGLLATSLGQPHRIG